MGTWFSALPAEVRSMHEISGDGEAAGDGSVSVGGGVAGSLIRRLMRFPPAGSYRLHVAFAERDGAETWTRQFGEHRFSSRLSARRGRLAERFGPLRFSFDVRSTARGLRMVLRGWDLCGLPLPMLLAPRIEASEWAEEGWFRFDVAVSLPPVGPVIHYRGRLRRV